MIVQRNQKEIIVKIPASVNLKEIQDLLNFIRYKELTSTFSVTQNAVDKLSSGINKGWWKKNGKKSLLSTLDLTCINPNYGYPNYPKIACKSKQKAKAD